MATQMRETRKMCKVSARMLVLALAATLGLACARAPAESSAPDVASGTRAEADPVAREAAAPERPAAGEAEGELVSVAPNINERYTSDPVESWTDRLERERREVIAERSKIIAALEIDPGMVVADVGAGTGAFMDELSEAVGPSGTLYSVDIIPKFLDHLRARAEAVELENVEVIEASPTAVNLPDESVDLLFLCDVYHHIEYPSVYLRSLHRALRPGGRLVIVEFDKIPGKTSAAMMKHVRQDKPTLLEEVTAEGFVLAREIDSVPLDENYMLEFRK